MVKAAIKGKREPIELEGDVILGITILYDAIRNSEVFIIGDVKRSILPGVLAGMAVTLLKTYFFGERAGESVCRFPYGISFSCRSSTGGRKMRYFKICPRCGRIWIRMKSATARR